YRFLHPSRREASDPTLRVGLGDTLPQFLYHPAIMLIGNMPAANRVELVEAPEPQLTAGGSGEVIFQPELACLCGSDLPFFTANGEWPVTPGHSLHEMIGRVLATNGERWKVGERVLC